MSKGLLIENAARAGKIHVVTKSDVGMRGASFVVGAFFSKAAAEAACKGPGTFSLMTIDANRAYARGAILDVEVIDNATAASIATAT